MYMKKLIAIMLIGLMTLSFAACGAKSDNTETTNNETAPTTAEDTKEENTTNGLLSEIDFNYTPAQAVAMSSFNLSNRCLIVDDTYYGSCWTPGNPNMLYTFSFDPDTMKAGPRTYIGGEAASWFNFINLKDDIVYAASDGKIVRANMSENTFGFIPNMRDVKYFFIDSDKMYYTDASTARLYSADIDGSNETLLIDKAVYYPHLIGDGIWLYQDDADNSSLHITSTKTGEDIKLNDDITYYPVICEGYIYAEISDNGSYRFIRIDPSTGEVEYSDERLEKGSFVINEFYGNTVILLSDGTAAELENWNDIYANSIDLGIEQLFYSTDKYYVTKDYNSEGKISDLLIHSNDINQQDSYISVNIFG